MQENIPSVSANILLQTEKRFAAGEVVSAIDFRECGSRAAIDQALSRLNKQGLIKRIAHGLYYIPKRSSYTQRELPPAPDRIALALSRKTGARVMPSGAVLANKFGLSEQVPAGYEYLTDGRSRALRLGALNISFRRTSKKLMDLSGSIVGEVYMALRYIGKQADSLPVREKLSKALSAENKAALNKWAPQAPEWMQPMITNLPS